MENEINDYKTIIPKGTPVYVNPMGSGGIVNIPITIKERQDFELKIKELEHRIELLYNNIKRKGLFINKLKTHLKWKWKRYYKKRELRFE